MKARAISLNGVPAPEPVSVAFETKTAQSDPRPTWHASGPPSTANRCGAWLCYEDAVRGGPHCQAHSADNPFALTHCLRCFERTTGDRSTSAFLLRLCHQCDAVERFRAGTDWRVCAVCQRKIPVTQKHCVEHLLHDVVDGWS